MSQPEFNPETAQPQPQPQQPHEHHLTRALVWIGIAGLTAALAVTVVRTLASRRPDDPTSQRIQTLIDEANQLLKTLDEQRHSA